MRWRASVSLGMHWKAIVAGTLLTCSLTFLQAETRVYADGALPNDCRLQPLKDLNGHFPFAVPATKQAWEKRAEDVRTRVLVANGLWPMPERTALNPVMHGKVEREGFTVEKVYFESVPGFYVTGLLFRPSEGDGPFPGVLSPHGHGGRLQDHGPEKIREYIVQGAERFEGSGRFPKVARCAQLARMGCVVLLHDMIGYADSQQLSYELAHRFAKQRPAREDGSWGFYSAQAELRLQSIMGLQTWNCVRALDFLESLPDVDKERLAVTGGSGGGTQTILLGAIDSRPKVAFPQGMVSTSMQGGCTCENTSLLRIGTGNVELTALFAPRPQAMTAADDWTKAMMSDGYPELKKVYQLYDAEKSVSCSDLTHFPHNYNYVTRAQMYAWFNRHLDLGLKEPIVEEDFPPLTESEHAVWNADHPKPESGDLFEAKLLKEMAAVSDAALAEMEEGDLRTAWRTLIGRSLPDEDEIEQVQVPTDRAYLSLGRLAYAKAGEEVPIAVMLPSEPNNGKFVLWIHGEGKASLLGDAEPHKDVQALLEKGHPVVVADLFGQGEFVTDGQPLTSNRTVENKREFAGYTFGYNDSLFAQRVHDILTVIAAMKPDAESITLVGTDGAGPWATVAAAVAEEAVQQLAVDTQGFRFSDISDYRDVNFLPGALKYGGLSGALALSDSKPLWLGGEATLPDSIQDAEAQVTLAPEGKRESLLAWLLQ